MTKLQIKNELLQDQLADIMAVKPESKGMASVQQFAIESLSKEIIFDNGIDCMAEIESTDWDYTDHYDECGVSQKTFY